MDPSDILRALGDREVVITISPDGTVVIRAVRAVDGLRTAQSCGTTVGMSRSLDAVAPTGAVDQSPLGRIEPAPGGLLAVIDSWSKHLLARNRRPKSVTGYRGVIRAAAKLRGWSEPAQLTAAEIMDCIDGQKVDRAWKAGTYNRSVCAFRSFTKYLRRSGMIGLDPMADADRATDDESDGGRAATVDEARAIVREAWLLQQTDGRAKGNRALYWITLFSAGLRVSEPALWTWDAAHLDCVVPFIHWRPAWQKNRKSVQIALSPELARLLIEHRGTVAHGASDPVFPVVPPRQTFRADMGRAGISTLDELRRRFSPHSARRYFSTVTAQVGIPEKFADFFLRHSGRVEHRYFVPDLQAQSEQVAKLPRLWPEADFAKVDKTALDKTARMTEDRSSRSRTMNGTSLQHGLNRAPRGDGAADRDTLPVHGGGLATGRGSCPSDAPDNAENRAHLLNTTGGAGAGDSPATKCGGDRGYYRGSGPCDAASSGSSSAAAIGGTVRHTAEAKGGFTSGAAPAADGPHTGACCSARPDAPTFYIPEPAHAPHAVRSAGVRWSYVLPPTRPSSAHGATGAGVGVDEVGGVAHAPGDCGSGAGHGSGGVGASPRLSEVETWRPPCGPSARGRLPGAVGVQGGQVKGNDDADGSVEEVYTLQTPPLSVAVLSQGGPQRPAPVHMQGLPDQAGDRVEQGTSREAARVRASVPGEKGSVISLNAPSDAEHLAACSYATRVRLFRALLAGVIVALATGAVAAACWNTADINKPAAIAAGCGAFP